MYLSQAHAPNVSQTNTPAGLGFLGPLCFSCEQFLYVQIHSHRVITGDGVLEALTHRKHSEDITLPTISDTGIHKQRFRYLPLCLRLCAPLLQETVALGNARGRHSMTTSPPTWTTEFLLMGFLEKSGAEAETKCLKRVLNSSHN